ncbi:hypothetical protein ACFSSA_04055 [Luteolibacter algae]|uniref:Uncharacterized protein n=1 Tax=Luteolibacter algae TaxID=454151 RepID=A0ABW5D740_9BACT
MLSAINPVVSLQLPAAITILCYAGVILLLLILLLQFRISGQLAALSVRMSKESRSVKLADPDAEPQSIEAGPGTPFEEFLNEDPQRRNLAKKEQFKAYRKWRADKGLNWSA